MWGAKTSNDKTQPPAQPVGWSDWLYANPCDFSGPGRRQNRQNLRNQRFQVRQSISGCAQYYHGDIETLDWLLKGQVPVNRQEDVELLGGERK